MHPIEHLRYLARAGDIDPTWVVPEAAQALAGLCDDPNALVMASRMLLGHLGMCGPLWWLCGQTLTAREPRRALAELVDEFLQDPTPLQLSLALTDAPGDDLDRPVVVDALIASASGAVVHGGQVQADRPIWVTVGLGALVPDRILASVLEASTGRSFQRLSPAMIDRVIRPTGFGSVRLLAGQPDVAFVPELLARG